ncbi:MAG: pseudaminic acid synthase [Blastochloris sp.]|nr:pseudaminic acid synthase [Blastochloris sp.]
MPDNSSISIAGRCIGADCPPFVIAELSGNHNGSLDQALELMAAAKTAGADAIKIQTYTADTITIDHDGPGFVIEGGPWHGRKLHELYREAHTPWEWHRPLFAKAKQLGMTLFSTPFDGSAIDLLEELEAPAYKIASFEAIDLPLVRRAAATRKPLVISTGMSDLGEISECVTAARHAGCRDLVLLHCVSAYPAPPEEMNLQNIPLLAKAFGTVTGLSDHTLDNCIAVTAVALGACVIEKHLTLARADGGPDSGFSLEPNEFATLVRDVRTAWSASRRGEGFRRSDSERANLQFRRSLYAVEDIPEGEPITGSNVRSIRPGYGLPPKHLPGLLGRRARARIARGTPMAWSLVD